MSKSNGGPAFPIDGRVQPRGGDGQGMSLRDWFAGQALVGLLASEAHPEAAGSWENRGRRALEAYKAADAMLIQHEKKPEKTS